MAEFRTVCKVDDLPEGEGKTVVVVLHDHSPQVGRDVVRKVHQRAFD